MAALKEWAVVCKALEEGRQILLLRKGGIMEYRQGFKVKHNKFLLFPTFEHQSKESIQPNYLSMLYSVIQNTPTNGKNKITSYADVADIKEVSDKSILRKLEKYHIWNDRYVDIRMNYNPKRPMSIILLRVYKMDNPIEVDVKSEWAGCTSWIPIEFPVHGNNDGRQPVLEDRRFNQIVNEIKEVLN
ncbi:MAG TPA: DUF1802 family protein [Nitrososphaeraceae archaeon]|nr:DUF1802 family protein [Nitrososphaeraceae archaeon]